MGFLGGVVKGCEEGVEKFGVNECVGTGVGMGGLGSQLQVPSQTKRVLVAGKKNIYIYIVLGKI